MLLLMHVHFLSDLCGVPSYAHNFLFYIYFYFGYF